MLKSVPQITKLMYFDKYNYFFNGSPLKLFKNSVNS